MKTRRIVVLSALAAMVGLGIAWNYVQGQTRKAAIAPESLLPEDSLILARMDGSLLHAEAYKKTAAYDALYTSGLVGFFEKTFNRAKAMAGPLPVKPFLDAAQLVGENGLSLAISPGVGERGPQPWGVVVLHQGASLDKLISTAIQMGTNNQVKPERKTIGKRTVVRIDIPDVPGAELGWWPEGKHLVVTFGVDAVQQAVAVADGTAANVTTNPLWTKYSQPRDGELTSFGWFNVAPLRVMFGGMPVPTQNPDKPTTVQDLLIAAGLDNLNSIGMQAGIKDRSLTTLTMIDAPGERRGLLSLIDQTPMSIADLPPLPQQMSGLFAASFDAARAVETLYDVAVDLESIMSPDTTNVESGRAMAKEHLGLDLIDDFLAGIGNVHAIYSDEAQATIGLAPILVSQVKDGEKLNSALNRLLVELLPQVSEGNARTNVTEKDGIKSYSIEVPAAGMAPMISVGEKWMAISPLPQPVISFNLRQAGELPAWSLDSVPEQTRGSIPESFTSLSIVDPRSTYKLLLGLAPLGVSGVQVAMNQSGMLRPGQPSPIQLSDLPPTELVTRYLYPNVSWSVANENGVESHSNSSMPGLPIPGGDGGSVSVAVPAVLVALLLPAVQQAREAARRTQSKNNMKQIGLAMHNYHDTFSTFPEGTVPSDDLEVDQRLSWMYKILPYLDQASLYNLMNGLEKEGYASPNLETYVQMSIPAYQNPAYGAAPGVTHYVGIGGKTEEGPTANLPSDVAGIFGYNRGTKIQDIIDGTSNTMMVAEAQGYNGAWAQGGSATIRSFTQQPYINGPDGIGGPYRGGCHILMADGAVRFVSENIDPGVVEALSTIQGGEVLGEF
jgi:hypothetical protein